MGTRSNDLIVYPFHNATITAFTYKGRPCVIARDIGEALGYSDDGKRLATKITGDWSHRFAAGLHHDLIDGQDFADLRACFAGTDSVLAKWLSPKARSVLVLYEPGIHKVVMLTDKPIGDELLDNLAINVLPKLVRGEPVANLAGDAPVPAVNDGSAKEARLMEAERRRWAAEERRINAQKAKGLALQLKAVAMIRPVAREVEAAVTKRIGELLAGESVGDAPTTRALPAPEGPPLDLAITTDAHYMSVSRGGAAIGISGRTYGDIVSVLCKEEKTDYRAGIPGFTRPVLGMSRPGKDGVHRSISQYEVTPAMNAKVAALADAAREAKAAERAEVERRRLDREAAAATKRAENERIRAEREARRKPSAPSLPFNAPVKGKGECA